MNWKKLPYWLKGGILGILISLIPILIVLLGNCNLFNFQIPETGICNSIKQLTGTTLPVFFLSLGIILLISTLFNLIGTSLFLFWVKRIIIVPVFFAIPSFIIGCIIGWIYGKTKKMKKQEIINTALIFIALYTLFAIFSFLILESQISDITLSGYVSSISFLFFWPYILLTLTITFNNLTTIIINEIIFAAIVLLLIWLSRYIDKKLKLK